MPLPEENRAYNGVKVFSTTMIGQRAKIGEEVTNWLRAHPECVPVDTVVRQSSDNRFHCLTIVVFWRIS